LLADTGGAFHQWVALNFTALTGDSIDSSKLIARPAAALQIHETAAEATIAERADEQLLQIGSESGVALNDAGRERYAHIRTAIDEITAPMYGDLSPGDVAVTRRVLNTIADRADTLLARARCRSPGRSSCRRAP
jgi:hypothetical protein